MGKLTDIAEKIPPRHRPTFVDRLPPEEQEELNEQINKEVNSECNC